MTQIVVADRVKETSTTTGTGTLDLAGAATGFQTFVAGAVTLSRVYYTIVGQAGGASAGEWEVGEGVVTDASPDTLSRIAGVDTLRSSNSDALVDFSAGTKDVFITWPAERAGKTVWGFNVQDPSAVAVVDFDITGYEMVRLVGYLVPVDDGVSLALRFSDDGGSTFKAGASDYAYAKSFVSVASSGDFADETEAHINIGGTVGNAAGEQIVFDCSIITPAESGSKTVAVVQCSSLNAGGLIVTQQGTGLYQTAAVTDGARLLFDAGNIASGHVAAYGYPAP